MKPLTHEQIEGIVEWMNNWEQLNGTVIPLRFKEDWNKKRIKKPPLGIEPKWIHDQIRQGELLAAINRYILAGEIPPNEWFIEFASYCK